ncbi:MAG: hypothetical protein M1832_001920 [Thelocarpon impressellum]|nr:MAG: hypothetical protein M1832_001920 [Thelocarpon impressellum]
MSDEAMILRREIRKPARYRPEPNPKLAEAFVPPVARPAFAPPYVAYNPDLPPAAFPSLSAPRPGGSRTDEAKDRPVSASGALTEAGRRWVERHDAAYGRWVEETANESELRDGGERGEEEPSEELIAARYTQAVRFDGSMARLGKMVQRTDEQWVEGEMKASDGEEEGPVRRRPVWNDLSPNHRTAIVTALLQAHALPTVYAILCLSDAQQREDQVHRGRRDERERLEDEKIAALQTELTEVLLTSDETQWERFPQSRR